MDLECGVESETTSPVFGFEVPGSRKRGDGGLVVLAAKGTALTGRVPCSKAALAEEERMKRAMKDEYRKEVYEMRDIGGMRLNFDLHAETQQRVGGSGAEGLSSGAGSRRADGRRIAMSATLQSVRSVPLKVNKIEELSGEAREYAELTMEYDREWKEKEMEKRKIAERMRTATERGKGKGQAM